MDKKYWFIISSLLIGCSDSSSEGDTNSEHDFSGLWQETTVLGEPFNITTKSQFILVDYGFLFSSISCCSFPIVRHCFLQHKYQQSTVPAAIVRKTPNK